MILDAIIAFFGSFFSVLAQGVAVVCAPLINGVLALAELIVGIVIDGFSIGRVGRKREQSAGSAIVGAVVVVLIVGLVAWIFLAPRILERDVTFVAKDGRSLPLAALIVRTKGGDEHVRTDNAGKITISRFKVTSITVKDPRYIEETWNRSEIESTLMVQRALLGSGLDKLADKFLKPAKN